MSLDSEQLQAILNLRASNYNQPLDVADFDASEKANVDTLNKRLKLYEALFTDLQSQINTVVYSNIPQSRLDNATQAAISNANNLSAGLLGALKDLTVSQLQMESEVLGRLLYTDRITDTTGIDLGQSSNFILDPLGYLRQDNLATAAVLVTDQLAIGTPPDASLVVIKSLPALGFAKGTFELSRDDGATYTPLTEGTLTDVSLTASTGVGRIRITLQNNQTLALLGFEYKTSVASPNTYDPQLTQAVGDDTVGPISLPHVPLPETVVVFLEGMEQVQGVDYTISGNQVTFTSIVPMGVLIDIYYSAA